MKERLGNHLVERSLDDESKKKFEHMQKKRAENEENLKTSMIGHLSALNDGVIAIFITVMMLEIPYPTSKDEYFLFAKSILIFLVSFFIIADFWYNNKRIFEMIKEADHMVVVADFMFLAVLAIIPVTTKWIMNQGDMYGAVNFGIVYFLTLLMEQFLRYAALHKIFASHIDLFFKIVIARIGILVIINMVFIVLGYFFPQQAIFLYIVLPVVDFFRPQRLPNSPK